MKGQTELDGDEVADEELGCWHRIGRNQREESGALFLTEERNIIRCGLIKQCILRPPNIPSEKQPKRHSQ